MNQGPVEHRTSAEVWEERYAPARVWSGRPNHTLVEQTRDLTPGSALELGSGEGADAIWLAEQGWRVTAVDVSATALTRAEEHARRRGVTLTLVEADVADWHPQDTYDLVTAFFLHSPVNFPRADIFARAAGAVAPGGVLLIVGHADIPPWSRHHQEHRASDHPPGAHTHPHFGSVEETIAEAGLTQGWEILVAENLPRTVTAPDGTEATMYDAVVKARRTGALL